MTIEISVDNSRSPTQAERGDIAASTLKNIALPQFENKVLRLFSQNPPQPTKKRAITLEHTDTHTSGWTECFGDQPQLYLAASNALSSPQALQQTLDSQQATPTAMLVGSDV